MMQGQGLFAPIRQMNFNYWDRMKERTMTLAGKTQNNLILTASGRLLSLRVLQHACHTDHVIGSVALLCLQLLVILLQ